MGEIKVDADGRHVYVSNRGHNSLATYSIDPQTGMLAREGVDSTLGKCPRHFSLSPCGGYAVVGDQDSDVVKCFKLEEGSGRIGACVQEMPLPCPNFVLFGLPAGAAPAVITSGASEAREQAKAASMRVASPVAVCAS